MVKLGNCYTNSAGEFIKIVSMDETDPNVFLDQVGRSYNKDGTYYFKNSKYDLAEIDSKETFSRIESILNKVPEILPCPIRGSSIDMRWDDSSDYYEYVEFYCSSSNCGFSYNPTCKSSLSNKNVSIEQKRSIERNCINEVNKRT